MALFLFTLQILLLGYFLFFALFNYAYALASLLYRPRPRRPVSGKRVAVVVVSYNEKEVLMRTINACERLTYANKTLVIGDDSNDGKTYPKITKWIKKHGGQLSVRTAGDVWRTPSNDRIILHRPHNQGYKAGNLNEIIKLLQEQGIEYMYLLDADWRPQRDAIERTLSELEHDLSMAFVQTRRLHYNRFSGIFQHCASLSEETEYEVELVGRQVLNHPILFTGCCALFRLRAITEAGGFTNGHLTEDIDLTNRLYLHGWRGSYLPEVINHGEIVPSYPALIRQQERWAQGTARAFKNFFIGVLTNRHLSWIQRLSIIRQNMYYTSAIAVELSILLALTSVLWIAFAPESYQANLLIVYMSSIAAPYRLLLFFALCSNIFPILVAIFKRRQYHELLFIPFSAWLSWSLVHTYFWANVKGLLNVPSAWFKTPKTSGRRLNVWMSHPPLRFTLNILSLLAFVAMYGLEWRAFNSIDPYAYFWIPAMAVSIFLH